MAPKAKATGESNGGANKAAKGSGSTPSTGKSPITSGTTTPLPKVEEDGKAGGAGRISRPDKATYDAEQEKFKKEIEALQIKQVSLSKPIGAFSKISYNGELTLSASLYCLLSYVSLFLSWYSVATLEIRPR